MEPDPIQSFDSSGVYSDSELGYPLSSTRTTYTDASRRIRKCSNYRPSSVTDSVLSDSSTDTISSLLNKSLRLTRRTQGRDCYNILVQMGNTNAAVEKVRKNTIDVVRKNAMDKLPSFGHAKKVQPTISDGEEELQIVSIPNDSTGTIFSTPGHIPQTFRPITPMPSSDCSDISYTMQRPRFNQRTRPGAPSSCGDSAYGETPTVYDSRLRADSQHPFGISIDRASSTSSTIGKSDCDICNDICNTFWRPYLTFNPYKHGDEVVDFGSLWPDQNTLKSLLVEAYQATSLRRSVLDICKLVIRCGPVRVLQTLIESRIIGIDQVFENGSSLLHLACLARNYEAVQYLCSAGISKKILDKYGRTAAQLCYEPRLRKVITSQSRGACQPLKPASMHDKETIFQLAKLAKDYDELQIKLQSLDFDVNREMNRQGDFLIHVVTRGGLPQLPQLLSLVRIEGAYIDLYNQEGKTPLMIAAESENAVMVDVMLCILGANLNAPNPNTGECALHYAAKNNNVNVVNCLISRGADFNLEDSLGNRPDDSAARFNAFDSQNVIFSHRHQRIQNLSNIVETGTLTSSQVRVTDLYQTNCQGDTLIMTAAKHNRVENLLVLIEREGCHIDAQHEKNGRTALAMASIVGHEDAVRELLIYDANPTIPDIHHELPLHYAIRFNHLNVAEVILQSPRSLKCLPRALGLCSTEGAHCLIKQAIHRRQTEVVTPDLFECALCGDARKLFCLLEDSDFVNPISGVGDWPLFLAADNGHTDVVAILHQFGGDVSRRHPATRNTVLHAACLRGHMTIVRYLLENCLAHSVTKSSSKNQRPLDINALNAKMKTALQIAAEKGYSRIVRLLLHAGAATAMLESTGNLFCCKDYQGVQVLIETKRDYHTREIMGLVKDGRKLQELNNKFMTKFDHNLRDKHGDTPLMAACRFACVDVIKFLLESAMQNLLEEDGESDDTDDLSDTDSGTVLDLGKANSIDKMLRVEPQEMDSIADRERRLSKCTQEASDADDVTYTDFAGSTVDFATSSMQITRAVSPRGIRAPLSTVTAIPKHTPRMYDDRAWIVQSTGHNMSGFYHSVEIPESRRFEPAVASNVPDISASNLFNYATRPQSSLFMTANIMSHVCAVNSKDGRTALHRLLESGDHTAILLLLVQKDDLCANIQDNEGWSPLHLACKLGRKKCVEKLTSLDYVDLNIRTLDGKLPDEMTNNRHIVNTIVKARELQPYQPMSNLPTIEGSIGAHSIGSNAEGASTINFETITEKFNEIKEQQLKK